MSKVIVEIDLNVGEDTTQFLPVSGVIHRLREAAMVFQHLVDAGVDKVPLSEAISMMSDMDDAPLEDPFVFAENAVHDDAPVTGRVYMSKQAFDTRRLLPAERRKEVSTGEEMRQTLDALAQERERETRN